MSRILVVVDDVDVRQGLGERLRLEGYEVAETESGPEALVALGSGPPPTVIALDLASSSMTGWDFRQALALDARTAVIPVVVASGLRTADQPPTLVYVAGFRFGPVELHPIFRAIERYCRDRDLRDEEAPTHSGVPAAPDK